MNFLTSMLGDGQGSASTMRMINIAVVAYLLGTHLTVTIKTGVITPFTPDELGLLGIVIGGKLVQNAQEKNDPTPPKPTL